MDWEKQDNELRKLMEGNDFLPDGENWNAQDAWKILQLKKQPVRRKMIPVWVRLAAAACVVGLFGGGFWYIQSTNSFTKSGKEFAHQDSNQSVETAKKSDGIKKIPGSENMPEINQEINDTLQPFPQSEVTRNERFNYRQTVIQQDKNAGLKKVEHHAQNGTTEEALANEIPGTQYDTELAAVRPVLPEQIIPQTIVVVPAPAKKGKTKVVHYNQLGVSQSTAPPVFVQTKREANEWEGLAIQTSRTLKEPSFQLKIDISPALKKSL